MNNVKNKKIIILLVLSLMIFTACTKNNSDQEIDQDEEVEVIIDNPISLEGLVKSPLTGLWIDEEIAERRPAAVMINNIKVALPQSGISEADIIYETLAEGDITRLVAVFQSLESERIGPIRSIRDYYFNIAFDHDAIIIHHGGSPQAFEAIKTLKPSNLNTLSGLEAIMAWRDPVRKNQKGMLEHSLYTSGDRILAGWNSVKYRVERKENAKPFFNFVAEEKYPLGEIATEITLPFSRTYISEFVYDDELKLYKKSHHKNPHIDENNREQLSFKNIIVQYTDIKVIPGDKEGRRDIKLVGEGKGIYITNGTASTITWSKKDHYTPTVFKNEFGSELEVNMGKTYIGIFPNNKEIEIK